MIFLHEDKEFKSLIDALSFELGFSPQLIEKDYWVMHCIWGVQQQNFHFEIKGGTSLSKGFHLIERFSEDVDMNIHPEADEQVPQRANQNRAGHVERRREFFENLSNKINIAGVQVKRDHTFDDYRMRNAGIALIYPSFYQNIPDLLSCVLLEVGFGKTTPWLECDISSWAYNRASTKAPGRFIDNRALKVHCYHPGYTLVEKMEAVCRKHLKFLREGEVAANFMRYYYDIYCLLQDQRALDFIGTEEYLDFKQRSFRERLEQQIPKNEALMLHDQNTYRIFKKAYENKRHIYYHHFIEFSEIIQKIRDMAEML